MPQPAGWTPVKKRRFIDCLAKSGNVSAAVDACGLSRQAAYKLRWRDAAFAEAWDQALTALHRRGDALVIERIAQLRSAPPGSRQARFADLLEQVLAGSGGA